MTKPSWIQIDPSQIIFQAGSAGKSSPFTAPHQIPKAIRGFYDEGQCVFVLELRYPDDEDFKRERQDASICFRLGKNSRRLLGLELTKAPLLKKSGGRVGTPEVNRIEQAVRKLIKQEPVHKEKENYTLAIKAIESGKKLLARELVEHL
jgi:hypothetical protein